MSNSWSIIWFENSENQRVSEWSFHTSSAWLMQEKIRFHNISRWHFLSYFFRNQTFLHPSLFMSSLEIKKNFAELNLAGFVKKKYTSSFILFLPSRQEKVLIDNHSMHSMTDLFVLYLLKIVGETCWSWLLELSVNINWWLRITLTPNMRQDQVVTERISVSDSYQSELFWKNRLNRNRKESWSTE